MKFYKFSATNVNPNAVQNPKPKFTTTPRKATEKVVQEEVVKPKVKKTKKAE